MEKMGANFKEGAVTATTKYDDVWLGARESFVRVVLGDPRGTGQIPNRYFPTLRALTFRFFERGCKSMRNSIATLKSKENDLEKVLAGE
jgi:hypothetical protein